MIKNSILEVTLNAHKLGYLTTEKAKGFILDWGSSSQRFNWFSAKLGYGIGALITYLLIHYKIIQ